ncbi:c-di-GMP-binding flagellar brake protein YcgR, contains PilZNR and PilZ domains [Propionispira arboris]|uniref:C-di-GMP-binding flagellar brake protein YcgR, contains PilZNR and PilZ domains n=1 Tax=Propionispira arboris TaxID=84035 RepID=A0A1H7AEN8_9FIRM|nr:flagellar brake domain-containing protein [Propionispira arboris]SEJ63014.1 c-di-GMP-binding flagellar brake protein YcgR, contains PilZNR and PilZ domains [Propionispira arboris]
MGENDKMKLNQVLLIGKKVDLFVGDAEMSYASRIEDLDEKHLILAMPMDEKRRPIIPLAGTSISGRVAAKYSMYKFNTVYQDKASEPIPVWIVSMPQKIEKHQTREFVRIPITFPLQVQVEDVESGDWMPPYRTKSIDVSGNGIRFFMNRHISQGTKVLIKTEDLPIVGSVQACCEVVRSEKPRFDEPVFWIASKFISLPKKTQLSLIRFIFQKQREMIAKGISE